MTRFISLSLRAGAALLMLSGAALAGEQYVDETGYAVSGYDVVAYFNAPQSPVGEAQPAPAPGRADITAEYNGAKFAFSTPENRDRFLADPAKYAPQYDGHCAYGAAQDVKVPGNPFRWRIVDGKLFLNLQKSVAELWNADIPGHIEQADANWSHLEPQAASANPVPELELGHAPLTN